MTSSAQQTRVQDARSAFAESAPLVSVIIPAYNNARFLPDNIRSILEQSYRNIELIVVDDGSTDNTQAVLAGFGDRLRYVRKANGGPSSARNLGIQMARGQLIAFQDADDLWLPEKVRQQVEFLHDHPDVGVVFSDLVIFNDQGIVRHSTKDRFRHIPSGMIFQDLLLERFIATSAVMVRRECLDDVGNFDESLLGAEDYNLYLRLARKYKFAFLDIPHVHKRAHEANLSANLNRMCEDAVLNLDKISALFPDARIPKRKLTAQIYLRFGKYNFGLQKYRAARRCFQKALQNQPWHGEAWMLLSAAALPGGLRKTLLAIKRSLRLTPPTRRLESSGD